MSDKTGVKDEATGQGAGFKQLLITAFGLGSGNDDPKLQGMDRFMGGEPVFLRSFSASITAPVISATAPAWQPLVYKVPAGKFFVPTGMAIMPGAADEVWARMSRRWVLAGNCATANPGAPSAPTVAVATHDQGIDEANGANTFDYKITQVNALNQETVASAASSTLTPTSAQRAIDVTLPALATGAVAIGVYRRMNAGAWEHLGDFDGGVTFRDTRPESNKDTTKTAPSVATWGAAFTSEIATAPCELIYACLNALSAAPARLVYEDDSGKKDNVAWAPATAAGTFLRIPLQGETKGWASPATAAAFQLQSARATDYGATRVYGFNNTFADMAGQWVIWGLQVICETVFDGAAPIAGGRVNNRIERPIPIPSGGTLVVEVGNTAAAVAGTRDLVVFGRLYPNPL